MNLHAAARAEDFPAESLFALAELSFLQAERSRSQSGFAAAMVYAWALLFPEDGREPIDPLDPRARGAADLDNSALTSASKRRRDGGGRIEFDRDRVAEGDMRITLPFGVVDVGISPDILESHGMEYFELRPVTELVVSGLRNRYRVPGIGSPIAARVKPTTGIEPVVPLNEHALVPLTVLVAIENPIAGLKSGHLNG